MPILPGLHEQIYREFVYRLLQLQNSVSFFIGAHNEPALPHGASWSRCRLSSRTDMTDNKRHAGDGSSPRSDHFGQSSWIFGRRCPAAVERLAGLVRFRPMKPFLNLLGEFGEIHLRNSRFSSKHNPIVFNAAHGRVFVYLAVSGFEVLRKCD